MFNRIVDMIAVAAAALVLAYCVVWAFAGAAVVEAALPAGPAHVARIGR